MSSFNPTHVSHKQVEAYTIRAAEFEADGSGKVGIEHPTRGYIVVPVPAGFLRRPGAVAEGDMLVRYAPTEAEPDGYLSHSPRAVFEAGYRPIGERGSVLMSPQNPTGWKLEDLLEAIREEVKGKCSKIEGDARPVARAVLRNNQQILGLLRQAEALQRDSYDRLSTMAPNQGPLGTPRIGVGSADMPAERAHDDLGRVA